MEPNNINNININNSNSIYSIRGGGPTMLGLEMSTQQQQQQQPPRQNLNPHQFSQTQMLAFTQDHPQSVKGFSFTPAANKVNFAQSSHLSDEDDLGGFNPDDGPGNGKTKMSPWHRMKWNDDMVMFLIMAVYYIGDEAGSDPIDPTGKKKGVGLLQKKGKWKTVSRALMGRGFCVSPQQCEDKFNDLNKRYKRVTDILGKGTACKVVENQALLETMDLTPKLKEEVKKLLNSKHLFFKEMCAYHNSYGHCTASETSGTHPSPELATEPANDHQQQQPLKRSCFHSSAQSLSNSRGVQAKHLKLYKAGSEGDDDDNSDEYQSDDEDGDDDVEKVQNGKGNDLNKRFRSKKFKKGTTATPIMDQLNYEMVNVIQDGSKSLGEKKQWMKMRLVQLKEQQLKYQMEEFEMEKQKMKWIKYISTREKEMDKAKLENERKKLENERMVLLIRQKELELIDLQRQQQLHHQQVSSNRRSDPSNAG